MEGLKMLKMDKRGVSPVVGTILLIAITVALAAIVATLVSGLGGRGAPPSAMLTVKAEDSGTANTLKILISHEGGDDLNLNEITISATDTDAGHMTSITGNSLVTSGGTDTLTVGQTATGTYIYTGFVVGSTITVFVIHNPSKQKIFSSSSIVIQPAASF
jgi:flagellin-like protein